MHLFPHAVPARFRLDDRLVEQIRQIIGMHVGAQDHIAAAAAIAAIGPAARDKFLAPETDAPAPAVTGLGENFDSIDKHFDARFVSPNVRTFRAPVTQRGRRAGSRRVPSSPAAIALQPNFSSARLRPARPKRSRKAGSAIS